MTTAKSRAIYVGNRNQNPDTWQPFQWDDPKHGPQAKGEVHVIRPEGTSGSLTAGLWRTGHDIPGCERDGSCVVKYSAPLGDETMVILEGSVEITETATGIKHQVEAGSIVGHPKGVDLQWNIRAPFLKKFWVMWDSPQVATRGNRLHVANISDNPHSWQPFKWVEPQHGPQMCGELFTVRDTGSTGTLMLGLWRTGIGIAGCQSDGSATIRYTAPLGDETILLLEGQAHVVNEETGQAYDLKAGDVIGLPSGLPITWTSKPPFLKKFFVITNAAVPSP